MKPVHTILASLLLAAALFAGCSQGNNQPTANGHEHGSDAAHEMKLQLNGEQKWEADKHTRDAVKGMQATLRDHSGDSQALGKQLQQQTDSLVRGCTMTGDAHNQLHIWLEQFTPAVKALATEQDDAKSTEQREKVTHLLDEYDRYFK